MPANATSVMAGIRGWAALDGEVAVPRSAEEATAKFRVDVPAGALPEGARAAGVGAQQTVTCTTACGPPPWPAAAPQGSGAGPPACAAGDAPSGSPCRRVSSTLPAYQAGGNGGGMAGLGAGRARRMSSEGQLPAALQKQAVLAC